jgi:DNA-binding XRE family transcriptional regulator
VTATTVGTRLISADEMLAEELKDPAFRELWARHTPARAVALRLVGYRVDHGLTQTALGRLLGMPQPAIARLESGDHVPSLDTLIRISDALGIEFLIDIKPKDRRTAWVSAEVEQATVVEKVATANGGEVLVAAS